MDDVYPAPHEADTQGEKDAERYKHMCETEDLKDQFVKENKMLGCDVYLYIAEVKQCTNVKEVKDIVRVLTKDAMSNTWMDQAQKDRACRAWASEKKVRMDSQAGGHKRISSWSQRLGGQVRGNVSCQQPSSKHKGTQEV